MKITLLKDVRIGEVVKKKGMTIEVADEFAHTLIASCRAESPRKQKTAPAAPAPAAAAEAETEKKDAPSKGRQKGQAQA